MSFRWWMPEPSKTAQRPEPWPRHAATPRTTEQNGVERLPAPLSLQPAVPVAATWKLTAAAAASVTAVDGGASCMEPRAGAGGAGGKHPLVLVPPLPKKDEFSECSRKAALASLMRGCSILACCSAALRHAHSRSCGTAAAVLSKDNSSSAIHGATIAMVERRYTAYSYYS